MILAPFILCVPVLNVHVFPLLTIFNACWASWLPSRPSVLVLISLAFTFVCLPVHTLKSINNNHCGGGGGGEGGLPQGLEYHVVHAKVVFCGLLQVTYEVAK